MKKDVNSDLDSSENSDNHEDAGAEEQSTEIMLLILATERLLPMTPE